MWDIIYIYIIIGVVEWGCFGYNEGPPFALPPKNGVGPLGGVGGDLKNKLKLNAFLLRTQPHTRAQFSISLLPRATFLLFYIYIIIYKVHSTSIFNLEPNIYV